ncbi:hypothetical protein M3Y99_00950900 [Aphelenchoides fujianensis]|nr:hypothetical protein M3Y99_00950900 [Aphelenchoides fujianensis]
MRNFRPFVPLLVAGLLLAIVFVYAFFPRRAFLCVEPAIDDWERGYRAGGGGLQRKDYQGNGSFVLNPVESVVDAPCRRNPAALIQRMRATQREINRAFQKTVTTGRSRYEMLPNFFAPAMDGFRYVLRPFKYWSQDEYKPFLEFSDPNAPCNHITFGVGGSWDGEKALRRKYPQCKMTGVDPTEALSRAVVESDPNSRFIHAAVSDTGGDQKALIKSVKAAGAGTFMNRTTFPHRAFAELLMNENEGRTVDFMTIDIEGAEFTLLRVLHEKRAELPVICQWNVEIHYADERYGVTWTEFDRTLNGILDEAYWVLLNVDERTWKYRRLFFFNVGAEECVTKFLC